MAQWREVASGIQGNPATIGVHTFIFKVGDIAGILGAPEHIPLNKRKENLPFGARQVVAGCK